jgi:hypothetical protein
VTEFERLCLKLAEHFDVYAPRLVRAEALRSAVRDALALMTINEILMRLIDDGPLTGARNPCAVLIARARQIGEDAQLQAHLAEEAAESDRWQAIDRAVQRSSTLRDLVDRGLMFLDEAETQLATEMADEDIRAFALDALRGGPS